MSVAGCSGDDPPPSPVPAAPSPSASPSPSPVGSVSPTGSTTPTATAPTLPAAARADTPAGAEAFARFWLTALDYAYKTGDTEPLRSAGTCRGCVAQANAIARQYESGGRIQGGTVHISDSSAINHAAGSAALVRVDYRQDAGLLVSSDGTSKAQPAVPRASLLFTLGRRGGLWTVTAIQPLKSS